MAAKPVPVADRLSEDFWSAAARGELALQRCDHCGQFTHPPAPMCTGCLVTPPSSRFVPVSGRGTITAWTIFRQAFLPGFRDDVPYAIVLVELAEQRGLLLLGRLVDGVEDPIVIGSEVEVVFDDLGEDVKVPAFALVGKRP